MQTERTLPPQTPVAVHCRYDGSWSEGFEIVDVDPNESAPYALRRRSDGSQLPIRFAAEEVRPAE